MPSFKRLTVLLLLPCFIACSNQINKVKNGKKYGRWVYTTDITSSKGRYFKGKEVGVWKDFEDGKLVKKERYWGKVSLIKNYYPNGKIESKGRTLINKTTKQIHWYFFGDWLYYDENGTMREKKTFVKGEEMISEKY